MIDKRSNHCISPHLHTSIAKEIVNYQEVYDLYQFCSETKNLSEFCADYGVNYEKKVLLPCSFVKTKIFPCGHFYFIS